ncbi:outer membrane protein assembly factor BamD [Alphaproteobacteria bacterium]|nr:outer membrane protein assembly factor BamD [Alphaproteobacteria bacterium]
MAGRGLFPAALLALAVWLAACAGQSDADLPPDEAFARAVAEFQDGNFKTAARKFDAVENRDPFSPLVPKAQLLGAEAWYSAEKYDDAVLAVERFLHFNPAHPDTARAHYIRAQSYYAQIADSSRDQQMTRLALGYLAELGRRYPDSEYARDAEQKVAECRERLAGQELAVGRFYQKNNNFVAALDRYGTVASDYRTTTLAPESLYRAAEVYRALGLDDLAAIYAAQLALDHADSPWAARGAELVR